MLKIGHYYLIEQIIECIKHKPLLGDDICIYTDNEDNDFFLGQQYWIDHDSEFDEADNEIFPPMVVAKKLEFFYSGQQFADVVMNAVGQKADVSDKEIVEALNYYSKNDNFMDIAPNVT